MVKVITKVCSRCGVDKNISAYARSARNKDGARGECKDCQRIEYLRNRCQRIKQACAYQKNNYTKVRSSALKREYGLTLSDFEALLESQDHKCAMCGTDKPGGQGDFHVDHDHATGRVRALLCHKCNTGLGLLGDNPAVAAERLYRYASLTCPEQILEGY